MYPKLFGIEFLNTYGLMIGIGIICALGIFSFMCKRYHISEDCYNFYLYVGIVSIGMGLFGSFAFQQLYNFIDAVISGTSMSWGGITFMGGLVTGAATFVVATILFAKPEYKAEFYKILNFAAPAVVAAHSLGRFGCFCAGCCYGVETDSIFGVVFPGHSTAVLPTNLFECIFLALLLGVMAILVFKFDKYDFLIILYGFAYSIWRFILEFYRDDYRGAFVLGLSPSQWQSIFMFIVVGVIAYFVYYKKVIPLYPKNYVPKDETAETEAIETAETEATAIETAETETVADETTSIKTETTDEQ